MDRRPQLLVRLPNFSYNTVEEIYIRMCVCQPWCARGGQRVFASSLDEANACFRGVPPSHEQREHAVVGTLTDWDSRPLAVCIISDHIITSS